MYQAFTFHNKQVIHGEDVNTISGKKTKAH